MLRNEADVVESFVRHNLSLLDGLLVVDHGSSDGTSEILDALVAIFEVVAPVLGLKRYARWARFASVAFAVSRIVNTRRSDSD